MKFVNTNAFEVAAKNFNGAKPFDHCVVDNFFVDGVAEKLEKDFIDYDSPKWLVYKNAIEDKKALNDWNQFPDLTYSVLMELMSEEFLSAMENILKCKLYNDPGLHGGGWHIHSRGGNLNPHLDYSIHPKTGLLRKVNIIMYLSSVLRPEHGGHLGLWDKSVSENSPGKLISEIQPNFNRAVIFDTTQNSWHGMSRPLTQPNGIFRKSLAIYYLADAPDGVDLRERALFAPREDQKENAFIKELIKTRADSQRYHNAYKLEG